MSKELQAQTREVLRLMNEAADADEKKERQKALVILLALLLIATTIFLILWFAPVVVKVVVAGWVVYRLYVFYKKQRLKSAAVKAELSE